MDKQLSPSLTLQGSRLFTSWLSTMKASIAFTTYQAGKLFLIGLQPDGRLSVFERTFDRPMGLGCGDRRFWMSSLYQLWRFENFLDDGEVRDGHDALFVPVTGHTTGDVDIHDIGEHHTGHPVFVVTRFNCLATLGDRGSFREVWRPPFIDKLASEDRCHLNGLALDTEKKPAFVTCVAHTNILEGWRDKRRNGGVLIDVGSGEVVAGGLSMPHSPRLYRGNLWVLQAGTGEFGHVDIQTGKFEPICFVPGFARGLTFIGDYAVVGLSRPRENRTFEGLALNEKLAAHSVDARCAICIINLRTGDVEHRLDIEGVVEEIYDVGILDGIVRPMAIGFRSNDIRFAIKPETS